MVVMVAMWCTNQATGKCGCISLKAISVALPQVPRWIESMPAQKRGY